MSKASITTSAPPPVVTAVTDAPAPARSSPQEERAYRVLEALASLKLTVVLFVLSVILVFCGTLAQIDYGIWAVVKMYFRSFYVWIPTQIFFPRTLHIPHWLGLPFPGGWTIGGLLLVNVLAAHLTRFKLTWKRSGILILHAGVIVLMLGELCTGLFAVEGNMTIPSGGSANYVDHNESMELADHRSHRRQDRRHGDGRARRDAEEGRPDPERPAAVRRAGGPLHGQLRRAGPAEARREQPGRRRASAARPSPCRSPPASASIPIRRWTSRRPTSRS